MLDEHVHAWEQDGQAVKECVHTVAYITHDKEWNTYTKEKGRE
jgi:uncharacterized membrane protein